MPANGEAAAEVNAITADILHYIEPYHSGALKTNLALKKNKVFSLLLGSLVLSLSLSYGCDAQDVVGKVKAVVSRVIVQREKERERYQAEINRLNVLRLNCDDQLRCVPPSLLPSPSRVLSPSRSASVEEQRGLEQRLAVLEKERAMLQKELDDNRAARSTLNKAHTPPLSRSPPQAC